MSSLELNDDTSNQAGQDASENERESSPQIIQDDNQLQPDTNESPESSETIGQTGQETQTDSVEIENPQTSADSISNTRSNDSQEAVSENKNQLLSDTSITSAKENADAETATQSDLIDTSLLGGNALHDAHNTYDSDLETHEHDFSIGKAFILSSFTRIIPSHSTASKTNRKYI